MSEKHFKEITITLGYWEDHPMYNVTLEEWRDWVSEVTYPQLLAHGSGPQYKVTIDTFGPWETGE